MHLADTIIIIITKVLSENCNCMHLATWLYDMHTDPV